MRTVRVGRGTVTHLVQEPKEGNTRPLKTLCGIRLMVGEHTTPMRDHSLESLRRFLDEDADPLCALCKGRLKGRLNRRRSR